MPRAPLAPISGNTPRRKELTPFQRGLLVGQVTRGATPGKIQKDFRIPRSTTRSVVLNSLHQEEGESRPRSGRPTRVSDRDRRHTIRKARENPQISYIELARSAGTQQLSRSTHYRVLKEYGLTNWLAKKRPLLTADVAAKRLAWCKEREFWTFKQWCKVI